jgi:hypothetical protein
VVAATCLVCDWPIPDRPPTSALTVSFGAIADFLSSTSSRPPSGSIGTRGCRSGDRRIPPIRGDLEWLKASLGTQTVSAALRWLLAALAFLITLAGACRLKDREETRREEMGEAVKHGVESIMNAEEDYLSTELGLDEPALDRALSSDAVVSGAFLNKINRGALVKDCIEVTAGLPTTEGL